MADVNLTQGEADALTVLGKYKVDSTEWRYPYLGGRTNIPLVSLNRREEFHLDLYRGGAALTKRSFQNRTQRVVILVRLCALGGMHRNPHGCDSMETEN